MSLYPFSVCLLMDLICRYLAFMSAMSYEDGCVKSTR